MPKRQRQPYEIKTKIVGVTFANDDGASRQEIIRKRVRPGRRLLLLREPDNPHSPDGTATSVWVEWKRPFLGTRRLQVGYLGTHISEQIAPDIDAGWFVRVTVLDVTGGRNGRDRGVNIKISMTPPGSHANG